MVSIESPGSRSARKTLNKNLRIDMTPMVDLGFLLIAFFVMTTEMSKPTVTHLTMPKEGNDIPPIKLGESNALTILINGDNAIFYYEGEWQQAFSKNKVYPTSLSLSTGLGKVIREKQRRMDESGNPKTQRKELMLLIKAGKQANYLQVIDALDETMINGVDKYALVAISTEEMKYISRNND